MLMNLTYFSYYRIVLKNMFWVHVVISHFAIFARKIKLALYAIKIYFFELEWFEAFWKFKTCKLY